MIELKKPTKINGQIIIPYYIKDGEVMCFDKDGRQVFINEKEFYKKPIQEKEVQVVIPIIKKEEIKVVDKPVEQQEIKKEEVEPVKKQTEQQKPKKEENKKEIKKDNIIKDEDYI